MTGVATGVDSVGVRTTVGVGVGVVGVAEGVSVKVRGAADASGVSRRGAVEGVLLKVKLWEVSIPLVQFLWELRREWERHW